MHQKELKFKLEWVKNWEKKGLIIFRTNVNIKRCFISKQSWLRWRVLLRKNDDLRYKCWPTYIQNERSLQRPRSGTQWHNQTLEQTITLRLKHKSTYIEIVDDIINEEKYNVNRQKVPLWDKKPVNLEHLKQNGIRHWR